MRSNIWKFYVFEMLRRAAFFVPVIVLFWQENGLSLTQVMVLQSLFAIAVVLFEVPTGYFADRGFFLFQAPAINHHLHSSIEE